MTSLKLGSFAFVMLVVTMVKVHTQASQDSLGPNGINSLVTGLDGSGVAIGQVEPSRPGLRPLFDGFDDPAHSGTTTDPELVAILETEVTAPFANIGVNDHAQRVAGVMISTHETATGVAPLAALYASAFLTPPPSQPEIALTAQFVALQAGGDVRAINFSFGHPLEDGEVLDGNSLLAQFMDWSARVHDVLYVTAGNETNPTLRTPVGSENFNGMTVAFSEKNADGVYRNIPIDNPGVTTGNVFTEDAFGGRTSTDIVAPGRNIETIQLGDALNTNSGTSYAAPHVTGTVALLQQHVNCFTHTETFQAFG